ncbi:protein of unknown function [Desulfovibrio sp. 86]|nr:protein of unknown function [Desulfovibrio sp. 86]
MLCKGFSEKSLPRNASRRAFACRTRAFQVLNALVDHAAGYAGSAAAQGRGLVGVVVAAGMNNHGAALEVLDGQVGGVQLALDFALGVGGKGGQVTLVTMLAGAFMLAGFIGVKMAASGEASHLFAVLFHSGARGIFMHVETVLPFADAHHVHQNIHAALSVISKGDEADGVAHAFIGNFIDRNLDAFRLHGACSDQEGAAHEAQSQQIFFHILSP